jgi:8-hydroxy-5-deazaflavin:NADPH oxidoreductase
VTSYSIIGAGAIGTALAQQFSRKKIRVKITNTRGGESLSDLTAALGDNVEATSTQDALKADVVILAVPFDRVPDAVRQAPAWDNRIVVDATNAIKFPEFLPKDLGGRLSTEVVAEVVPGARVVKAFNTLPAAVLARVPDDDGRRVVFLSGNNSPANAEVAALANALGYAPIVLGSLNDGKSAQFGGALTVHDLTSHD